MRTLIHEAVADLDDSTAEIVPQKKAGLRELDQRVVDAPTILVLTLRGGEIAGVREQYTP